MTDNEKIIIKVLSDEIAALNAKHTALLNTLAISRGLRADDFDDEFQDSCPTIVKRTIKRIDAALAQEGLQ